MSFTMHGIPVSGGIAIGHAHLVSHARLEVAHYIVPQHQVAEESARFDAALNTVRAELEELRTQIPPSAPREFEAFLNLHLMILNDSTLSQAPRQIIVSEQCNAEWALKVQMDVLLDQFDQIEDGYLRDRKTDVIHVVERLLKTLLGQPGYMPVPAMGGEQSLILVARDLSPADVIQFRQHQFASFITDLGGTTSHTTIAFISPLRARWRERVPSKASVPTSSRRGRRPRSSRCCCCSRIVVQGTPNKRPGRATPSVVMVTPSLGWRAVICHSRADETFACSAIRPCR